MTPDDIRTARARDFHRKNNSTISNFLVADSE